MTLEPTSSERLAAPDNLAAGWESSPSDPHEFLAYIQESITPEMLIHDRPAQAKLDYVLGQYFYHGSRTTQAFNIYTGEEAVKDHETDYGLIHNPAPEIVLRHTRDDDGLRGTYYIRDAFRLKEGDGDEHYYFFHIWSPFSEVPAYLRSSDIVPSGKLRQTFPPEAMERMKKELGINEDTFNWLFYNCDPRLASYHVLEDIPFNKPLERVPVAGGPGERFNYIEDRWELSGGNYDPGFRARTVRRLRSIFRPKLQAMSRPELNRGQ